MVPLADLSSPRLHCIRARSVNRDREGVLWIHKASKILFLHRRRRSWQSASGSASKRWCDLHLDSKSCGVPATEDMRRCKKPACPNRITESKLSRDFRTNSSHIDHDKVSPLSYLHETLLTYSTCAHTHTHTHTFSRKAAQLMSLNSAPLGSSLSASLTRVEPWGLTAANSWITTIGMLTDI